MNKNIYFISGARSPNKPVGIRHMNIIKHLCKINNITVHHLKRKGLFNNSLLIKMIHRIPFIIDNTYFYLKNVKHNIDHDFSNNKYDVVILSVLPFSFLHLAKYIKRRYSTPIVVDMTDPISINVGLDNRGWIRKNILLGFEKKYLPYVDHLVVLSDYIRDYYNKLFPKMNISVIEQGHNIDGIFNNTGKNRDYDDHISLVYAGVFYKKIREPFELYSAISRLENVKLSIYGKFKNRYIYHCNNIYYPGQLSQDEIYEIYRSSDVVVLLDNFKGIQVPGKIYEVLSTNKPILFIYNNPESPSKYIASNYDGVFYSKNKAECIIEAINKIIKANKYQYNRDLRQYTWEYIVNNKYQKLLNAVINNHSS